MRLTSFIVVAAATAAVVPSVATGATITSDGTDVTYNDRGAAADLVSSNTAPPTFTDAGGVLVASGACTSASAHQASCTGFRTTATLGAGADTAKIASLGPVTISGGNGDDGIYDWGALSAVDGGSGSDLLIADANGSARVTGGPGADRVYARGASVTATGDDGSDFVVAETQGPASASGGIGNDTLVGIARGSAGTLDGGAGADVLAVSGTPLIATAGWTLTGGDGNDVLDAAGDGDPADTVTCGAGRNDTAYVDAQDVVGADCEHVVTGPAPDGSPAAAAIARAASFKAAVATLHPNALTTGPLLPGF